MSLKEPTELQSARIGETVRGRDLRMRVAVVGAGITGLTIAERLVRLGHEVVLFEKGRIGGLAAGFPYRGSRRVYLEKFYHHIFTHDDAIIQLIRSHGLWEDVIWRKVQSGLIARGRVWPFNSPLDLVRLSPMGSLWQRLLMGWNLWRLSRTEDWRSLEGVRCREFFERRGNLAGYRFLWETLLKQKFADRFDDVAASFLWGRLRARAASKQRGGETLGYLRGGFQHLLLKMVDAIRQNGGRVCAGRPVVEIEPGVRPKVTWADGTDVFDRVVWTASPYRLLRLAKTAPDEAVRKAKEIDYLAVTELILVLKRRQTPFYWLNSVDPLVSFGGLIEHTNLVPEQEYRGEHVLYVVNYHRPNDARFGRKSAEALLRYHMPSLARVIPGFRPSDVLRAHSIQCAYASPLYDLGFAARRPPWQGWLPQVDICGMAQVYPEDRNMSHCVDNAVRYVAECFETPIKRPALALCAQRPSQGDFSPDLMNQTTASCRE